MEPIVGIGTALGTVIGTAAVLVLRDWRDGKSIFKKNGTAESVKAIKEMRDIQLQLQSHFNDETTVLLREIRDGVLKTNSKLEEFEKYGIPARK